MLVARIAELLVPFLAPPPAGAGLSLAQLQDISTYIDILLRWNASINLTAVRDPEGIVTRHFGESLFAARHLLSVECSVSSAPPVVKDVVRVADVGSGAGFPGIPIRLWAPQVALTLIESNQKKVAFLREVCRVITLTDIDIFPGRAENLIVRAAGPRAPFDLVTLRAVERFQNVLPIAAQLLAPGGRLALLVGESQATSAHEILPSMDWQPPITIPLSNSRKLLVGKKHLSVQEPA
jgi:16S rRNA (guanine527-N7)-methyltransferase